MLLLRRIPDRVLTPQLVGVDIGNRKKIAVAKKILQYPFVLSEAVRIPRAEGIQGRHFDNKKGTNA